jgi:hypothetical protein
MTSTVTTNIKAAALIALGLAIAVIGVYVADADDAPGAAAMGFVVMFGAVVLGVRTRRGRLPRWAERIALAVGGLIAAFAGFLAYGVAGMVPLFAQAQDVPSVIESPPAPQYAAAVARARELVRAAVLEQNLPGVSVAVGAGGGIVWAEGFGWRDVGTETPVTPNTRFNIGTAASAVPADTIARLGLTYTGAEPAEEWSPEAIGGDGEDFPPLTLIRHNILQPLGIAPLEYPIPGDRATFYVPRSEDNNPRQGRRLMYVFDLACCAGTMASYSTAPDLVRVGLANAVSVNGELAGGMVSSLLTLRDSGIVVAVLSNIAHANTSALGLKIGDAFAKPAR